MVFPLTPQSARTIGLRQEGATRDRYIRVHNVFIAYSPGTGTAIKVRAAAARLKRGLASPSGKEPQRDGAIVSDTIKSQDVIDYFADRTGEMLEVKVRSPELVMPTFERLGPITPPFEWLGPADGSKTSFGQFRVDVFRSHSDALEASVPNDSRPDSNGICWTWSAPEHKGDSEDIWLAAKVYRNVALYWWNDQGATDPRWHELDAIFTDLAQANPAASG
jgi:hypothetical protein